MPEARAWSLSPRACSIPEPPASAAIVAAEMMGFFMSDLLVVMMDVRVETKRLLFLPQPPYQC
jgi:hypothetical protein